MNIGRICLQHKYHKSPVEAILLTLINMLQQKVLYPFTTQSDLMVKMPSRQVPIGRWQLNCICWLEMLSFRWGYLLAELSRQFLGVDWKRVGRCESPFFSVALQPIWVVFVTFLAHLGRWGLLNYWFSKQFHKLGRFTSNYPFIRCRFRDGCNDLETTSILVWWR